MIDINNIQNKRLGKIFKPLYIDSYGTVENALSSGIIKKDSQLIVFQIGGKHLAFSKHEMAFHHIAQGYMDGKPYLLTLCVICNSGMVLNPVVDGKMLHFYVAGVLNGMELMADKETGTYWDHITGEGLHGKYAGHHLDILQSHQILSTTEVIDQYADCIFGQAELNFFQHLMAKFQNWKANVTGKGFLPPNFRKSMPTVDPRLPEMEMGLGVWTNSNSVFYPLRSIKQNGNYLFDEIDGNHILIYISPATHTPVAIYVDNVSAIYVDKNKIVFQSGDYIISGKRYSKDGKSINIKNPNHMFSRWYGYSFTFPKCEIRPINK